MALVLAAAACSSEPEAPPGPPPPSPEAEARHAGFAAWRANVEARQRAAQARRAAAEAEDLGPPPTPEALRPPVEGWLRLHLGDLALHDLMWAPAASRVVVEAEGEARAAWSYEVAVSPRKGPWELRRFALREGKILSAVVVEAKEAEPRLKELLGVDY
jgi:hypothetical protein